VDPTSEVEAFIRFVALNPHKLEAYLKAPRAFLDAMGVGDEARAVLESYGPDGVRRAARAKADEVYNAPEAAAPNTYGRDESAKGFGSKS